MSKPMKILVSGDVNGEFDKLFNRINAVQKKTGKFDVLFCVGEFFGPDNSQWEKYQNGEEKVPIPTFVLGPTTTENESYFTDPNGCELCQDVTYLGRKGCYTGSSGMSVVYVSGAEGGLVEMSSFTTEELGNLQESLLSQKHFSGIDVLLSSPWPRGVEKYGSAASDGFDSVKCGSEALAQLAISLKPRYYFCGLEGVHYERQPYRNHKVLQGNAEHCTRFIALAKVGNTDKKKFLYAFSVVPMRHMDADELVTQPADCTERPFIKNSALLGAKKGEKSAQYFYDQKAVNPKQNQKRQREQNDGPPNKKPPAPKGPCWFCLGSPEVEKHLVVSIGTNVYMALAKGGLNEEHVLILPIGHYQSTCSAPKEVKDELEKYKTALRKCLKSKDKVVVFFERNFKTQHLQIQAVSLPSSLTDEIKETFQGCALNQNIELHEIPKHTDLSQIIPSGAPYFYVELPSGEKLLYRISKNFPLQFGREALAHDSLLNLGSRVDWRDCKHSQAEEKEMAQNFRDVFEKFDFNLE